MRTRLAIAALGLTLFPLFACSSTAVQPEPGVSPKDAPKLLAQAICPKAYDCCMAKQLMGNDQAGTDVATCETKTEASLTNQVAGIEASERKGRVNYDGLKVQACLDYLGAPSTTCDALDTTYHLSGVPACATFLEPKVAVGDACTNDFECIDGFCDTTAVAAGADGNCRAFAKVGESCASMGRCEPGSSCDTTAMTCTAAPAAQPTAPMCFYSTACSYGGGRPGAGTMLGVGLMVAVLLARSKRRPGR